MKRAITALLALVLLAAGLCACAKQSAVKEESPIAVQLGGRTITLAEVEAKYTSMLNLYVSYGYAKPSTARAVEKLQDEVITELLNSLMLLHQADLLDMGELDAAQTADVRQTADEQMESLVSIYIKRAKENGKLATRKAAIREIEALLTSGGMNLSWDEYGQYLYDELYKDRVISNLKAYVTRDVAVTDEDIAAYYEQTLAAQQVEYDASAAACVNALSYFDKSGEKPVLYVPEGIVRVRILTVNGVSMKAQRAAQKAYAELQNGADFADVLLAYGQDSLYTKYPVFGSNGVPFQKDGADDDYDAKVYAAVNALSAGGYSEPIVLDEACVIVNLVGSEASGARALSQVRDAIRSAVLTAKQDAAWSDIKTEWCSDFSQAVYYEDVYRGVGK